MIKKISAIALLGITMFTVSCEKDEGKLPEIMFKTGAGYTSTDVNKVAGSEITIGIEAEKNEEEKEDVLKKFDISKSVNGGTNTSVYNVDLEEAEGDAYAYDYTTTVGTTAGDTEKYTFTVTNRDGLTNQVSLTITIE